MPGLVIEEQETCINFMRDQDFAIEYTSDSTEITLMDKLCKNNPEQYQCIDETKYGKHYKFPKRFISHRKKDREMSDDQRKATSERFRKMWQEKTACDASSAQ